MATFSLAPNVAVNWVTWFQAKRGQAIVGYELRPDESSPKRYAMLRTLHRFRVENQGHEALMSIESGEILAGELPSKAVKLVREWAKEHHQELLINWQYAIELKPLQRIAGADND